MVIVSEEYIKEITQEVTGALSSHGVVSIIGLTAGGSHNVGGSNYRCNIISYKYCLRFYFKS